MLTGLKAFGNTTKSYPGWAVVIVVIVAVVGIGLLMKIRSVVLSLPGVGGIAAKLGAGVTPPPTA
jgi:hypothetical protein